MYFFGFLSGKEAPGGEEESAGSEHPCVQDLAQFVLSVAARGPFLYTFYKYHSR